MEQYVEREKRAACAATKIKRQQPLFTFNRAAWDRVKTELRPALAVAVINQDWNAVYSIWQDKKHLVERAVSGG